MQAEVSFARLLSHHGSVDVSGTLNDLDHIADRLRRSPSFRLLKELCRQSRLAWSDLFTLYGFESDPDVLADNLSRFPVIIDSVEAEIHEAAKAQHPELGGRYDGSIMRRREACQLLLDSGLEAVIRTLGNSERPNELEDRAHLDELKRATPWLAFQLIRSRLVFIFSELKNEHGPLGESVKDHALIVGPYVKDMRSAVDVLDEQHGVRPARDFRHAHALPFVKAARELIRAVEDAIWKFLDFSDLVSDDFRADEALRELRENAYIFYRHATALTEEFENRMTSDQPEATYVARVVVDHGRDKRPDGEPYFFAHCLNLEVVGVGENPEAALEELSDLVECKRRMLKDTSLKYDKSLIAPLEYWLAFHRHGTYEISESFGGAHGSAEIAMLVDPPRF